MASAELFKRFADLDRDHAEAEHIAVDIPIGLSRQGARAADREARARLRRVGRSASLFTTPPRPVLEAGSSAEALAVSGGLSGASASGAELRRALGRCAPGEQAIWF